MQSNASAVGDKANGRRRMKQHSSHFFFFPISNLFLFILNAFFNFIKKAGIGSVEKTP